MSSVLNDFAQPTDGSDNVYTGAGTNNFTGTFKIGGVELTATAAQLNYLDVTPGTQEATKAVVANSDINIGITKVTELHIGATGAETQVTATAAELNYNDITAPGTQEASKAVVADANVNTGISKVTELHIGVSGSETQVTASGAELNKSDVSAQAETIDSGVAVSVLVKNTKIDNTTSGAGARTLAAPDASMYGLIKTIEMTVDGGDTTLALTNVQGGSAATTATFGAVNDCLTLLVGTSKYHVIGESGVVLS